jgi:hypothetical protein
MYCLFPHPLLLLSPPPPRQLSEKTTRARILKHLKVTSEKIALGKVNFSNGILKQPDFSLTAVCQCGQEAYSLATGLNAAVLVTLIERQPLCLRIPKMQVWLERYLFKRKVTFSTYMKCLRIRAQRRNVCGVSISRGLGEAYSTQEEII